MEAMKKFIGGASEEGVAVIDAGCDQSVDEDFCIVFGEGGAESGDVAEMKVCRACDIADVGAKGKCTVQNDAETFDMGGGGYG